MTTNKLTFTVQPSSSSNTARRGILQCPSRNALQTPHYIAVSSRGVVPHLMQDMIEKHTDIKGAYYALEDFLGHGSSTPPIIQLAEHDPSALRRFTALSDVQLTILGPRRIPPIVCPSSSNDTAISISTSTGFAMLKNRVYIAHAQALNPDIVVGLADLPSTSPASNRRLQNIGMRTEAWTQQLTAAKNEANSTRRLDIFAPILPVDLEAQRLYLDTLADDMSDAIDGLAIYSTASATLIPARLAHLARLSMGSSSSGGDTGTPQQILHEVVLGVDLFALEFVSACTDAGVALVFDFPASAEKVYAHRSQEIEERLEMGIDMWSEEYATNLSPLTADCDCYTCRKHHRAYIHHLLVAKEMLAWTLLQIHNYAIIDRFFEGVRRSIERGEFERDVGVFGEVYVSKLPKGVGEGEGRRPRIRGYQRKSSGPNSPKANAIAYKKLNPTTALA